MFQAEGTEAARLEWKELGAEGENQWAGLVGCSEGLSVSLEPAWLYFSKAGETVAGRVSSQSPEGETVGRRQEEGAGEPRVYWEERSGLFEEAPSCRGQW